VKNPSKDVILNDGANWWTDCWNFNNFVSGTAPASLRHMKTQANFLFMDGHAQAASLASIAFRNYRDDYN